MLSAGQTMDLDGLWWSSQSGAACVVGAWQAQLVVQCIARTWDVHLGPNPPVITTECGNPFRYGVTARVQ